MGFSISVQLLAESPSLLKDMRVDDGVLLKDLHSILTFEPLQDSHRRVARLLKTFWIQHLSQDETYSCSGGLPGKQKRLNLVTLPLLNACSGILAHTEEKCPVPGLCVESSKKNHTELLNGLFKRDGL